MTFQPCRPAFFYVVMLRCTSTMYFRSHNGLPFIRPKPALNWYVAFCEINVADFVPGRLADQAVGGQTELFLEFLDALFGGAVERPGDFRFAERRVIFGNAGELPLQRADAGAGRTEFQRDARPTDRDVGNVVAGEELDPVSVVIAQNLQRVFALVRAVYRAPLFHARTGNGLSVAVFGKVRFLVARTAHIGVEQLGSQFFHYGKHRTTCHIGLVIPG